MHTANGILIEALSQTVDLAEQRAAQLTELNDKLEVVMRNYLELISQHRELRAENDMLRAMIKVKERR